SSVRVRGLLILRVWVVISRWTRKSLTCTASSGPRKLPCGLAYHPTILYQRKLRNASVYGRRSAWLSIQKSISHIFLAWTNARERGAGLCRSRDYSKQSVNGLRRYSAVY